MSTTTVPATSAVERVPPAEAPRTSVARVVRSEWIKLRSMRSTWLTLAGLFAAIVAFGLISAAVSSGQVAAPGDGPAFAGSSPLQTLYLALTLLCVFGLTVLIISRLLVLQMSWLLFWRWLFSSPDIMCRQGLCSPGRTPRPIPELIRQKTDPGLGHTAVIYFTHGEPETYNPIGWLNQFREFDEQGIEFVPFFARPLFINALRNKYLEVGTSHHRQMHIQLANQLEEMLHKKWLP